MNQDVPVFVPQEVCLACEGCCRFLSRESNWRPKVMPSEETAAQHRVDSKGYVLAQEKAIFFDEEDMDSAVAKREWWPCSFLTGETNKCRIYDSRPFECRLYPFILKEDKDRLVLSVHLSCPYVQDVWETEDFSWYVEELRSFFLAQQDTARFQPIAGDYAACQNELKDLFDIPLNP